MTDYYLFGTAGCHLCEQAQSLLDTLEGPVNYACKDIIDQPEWSEQYSIRIPVFHHLATGKELDWPFDRQSLFQFIKSQ